MSDPTSPDAGSRRGVVVALVAAVLVLLVLIGAGVVLVASGRDAGGEDGRSDRARGEVTVTTTVSATVTETSVPDQPTAEPSIIHPDTPGGVVDAFLEAVSAGDCVTATELVSDRFLTVNGTCDEGMPSEFTWTLGAETIDDGSGRASVETTLQSDDGSEPATFRLVLLDDLWEIDDVT